MKIGKNSKKMLSLTIASAGMAAVLTGCGGGEESGSEAAGSEESGSDESIVIEHAFGETVLEEAPERVATIQWGNQDTVLALDEVPVGFSAANFGPVNENGVLPWTQEKMDELEVEDPNVFQDTDGLDFEAISDSNPDVILAAYSGITQEDYDLLSEIAPVVAYPETPWTTSWLTRLRLIQKGWNGRRGRAADCRHRSAY
ncbi:ABC transporter substrate-binding protein [Sinobaca sp. H24]|uniref:ABC transporter substrate-binding protein n=1 Tax=Sinobaca sp. H24 TaxID=2923376 RepID=UPI0035AE8BFD